MAKHDASRALFCGLAMAGGLLAACQTPAMTPAVLAPADAGNLAKVTTAMREATGQARLELGPVDAAAPGEIFLLPPPPGPFETHSLAVPVRFDIMMQDGACFAVDPETGTAHRLAGVACAPRQNDVQRR